MNRTPIRKLRQGRTEYEAQWFAWAESDLSYKAPEQLADRVNELTEVYAVNRVSVQSSSWVRTKLWDMCKAKHPVIQ